MACVYIPIHPGLPFVPFVGASEDGDAAGVVYDRVMNRPLARVAGSVNSSLLFTVTVAEGYHAEPFWQEGSKAMQNIQIKTNAGFFI
jgi:hypothetical protein